MHNFIVQAWRFNADGKATAIDTEQELPVSNFWLHCNRAAVDFEQWLYELGISESVITSLLAADTRPRFHQIDNESFFLILRGVNLNPGKAPDDMLSIRLLYTPQFVITCNLQHSKAIQAVADALTAGEGPENKESLLHTLLEQVHDKIESVIWPIEEFVEAQDQDVFTNENISEISIQHRKLLRLNRFLKPQTHALAALCKNRVHAFAAYEVNLANQLDYLQRIVDSIDFYLAQIEVLNNRIAHLNSEVMNRNTYLLSIIAGIFLPLGFLTGLFGINIGGMPGVENNHAFYWFCGILTGIGLFELYLFRRWKFL